MPPTLRLSQPPTPHVPHQATHPNQPHGPPLAPWPLPESLWLAAAARLVATDPRETLQAAQRLVEQSASHGIDLSLATATFAPGEHDAAGELGQVCLPVLSPGRTAMLFVSRPGLVKHLGPPEAQQADRIQAIRSSLEHLRSMPEAALAQGLSSPSEHFAMDAFEAAGLTRIAELRYLQRPLAQRTGPLPEPGASIEPPRGKTWPGQAEVRAYAALNASPHADAPILAAIEASYEDTLDCPALRSLRTMDDVIESHRQTGDWTPGLWWQAHLDGQPAGCLLLNPSPLEDAVELVYMGLAPSARGLGLASALLQRGIEVCERLGHAWIRCAVDVANRPAARLYERAGFVPTSSRIAHAISLRNDQ